MTGRGAAAFLSGLVTGNVDKSVGSVTYCLLLDDDGGIRSDVTVARLAVDRFQVGANGNLDLDWFTPPPAAGRHGAGPRHHPGHLLHRALGPAGPRRAPAADRRRLLGRRA